MRIEIQWNSLFPLSMPYVTTLRYREIFWQNGSLLYGSDTAKQEFFMRLQLRLQSLHKHDFISNQLLFYCWLTQQHFNFSVSFSFNNTFIKSKFCCEFSLQLPWKRPLHPPTPPPPILMNFCSYFLAKVGTFWCLSWEDFLRKPGKVGVYF